jgi:hypothetical protein
MHAIKSLKYAGGYRLELTFEDSTVKIIDLKDELYGEIFEPLKNIDYFKQAYVNPDIETVSWPNGADLCPDYLYEKAVPTDKNKNAA